jgi:hypothetical protein
LIRKSTYALTAICLVMSAFATGSALAVPRLSVSHSTSCRTCHVNPNGGGQRNEYGSLEIALNELSLPLGRRLVASHVSSDTTDRALLIGFDFIQNVDDHGVISRDQTDAYLTYRPLDKLSYSVRVSDSGIVENYGLLTYDSLGHFSAKAGRFYPVFGLRTADYTGYHRSAVGLTRQTYQDGVSLCTEWYGVSLTVEGFSFEDRSIYGAHLSVSGRVGRIGWLAGGSRRQPETISGATGEYRCAWAVFAGLSAYGFTALGELDLVGKKNDTLAAYASLQTQIIEGAVLVLDYDFLDTDRSLATGIQERISVSLELHPIPYVELRPVYRSYTEGNRKDEDEFAMQLHFGF